MISGVSKHTKQIALLSTTTFLGVLMGIISSVINTHALTPELYGDVRYVQNIISFISSLLLMGFFVSGSRLLALSNDEQYSRRIRGTMCIILAITVLVIMLCMLIIYMYSIRGGTSSMQLLWLASIPVCGNVVMLNYINTTAQGDNHIGRIAIARLLPSILYCAVASCVYHCFKATPVLMLLLYNGISVIILLFLILSTHPSFVNLTETFHLLVNENKKYGFDVYLGSVVGVSTGYISGITLGYWCEDNTLVGFYTLALTVTTPLTMLPGIVGTTLFKSFSSAKSISRKVLLISLGLTIISCVVFITIIGFIIDILYDANYYNVSTYARWLAVGSSIHGLGDMINRFLGAHGQGRQIRNSAIACGLIKTMGSLFLVYYWQIDGAIVTNILGSTVYLGFLLYYYICFIKKTV